MTVVYLLAAIQALFLCSLVLAKQRRSFSDRVLMLWLAGIGLHTLIYFLHFRFGLSAPFVTNLNAAFPFLQGPFLLGWVAALVGSRKRLLPRDYLHFVPALAFVGWLLFVYGRGAFSLSHGGDARSVSLFATPGLFGLILLVSVPVYIVWSLVLMHRAARALDSPDLPARFRWIRYCIGSLGAIWLGVTVSFFLARGDGHPGPPHLVFWALTLFVYGLGYLGVNRASVFSEPELEALRRELQPKYARSGLGLEEARTVHAALVELMERERPWLDGELSLQSLADDLGFSVNHLSQAINMVEGQNFHDFINARRVREVCQRLDEGSEDSLLSLAMGVGFNSKSSFNRAFRKFTGKTPSMYRSRPDGPANA